MARHSRVGLELLEQRLALSCEPLVQRFATVTDNDGNGIPEEVYAEEKLYDSDCQLVREVGSRDFDGDGFVDLIEREVIYNSDGQLILGIDRQDYDRDGVIDAISQIEIEYDMDGRILSETRFDDVGVDGDYEQFTSAEYEYDRSGNLVKLTQMTDYDGDGHFFTSISERTYDKKNDLVTVTVSGDYDEDPHIDLVSLEQTFDGDGNELIRVERHDNDQNGTVDYFSTRRATYNETGDLLSVHVVEDYDGDGTIDFGGSTEFTYDTDGNGISTTVGLDYDGDGTDEIQIRESVYDSAGAIIWQIERQDYDRNGTADSIQTQEDILNPDGTRTFRRTQDSDGNGVPEQIGESLYDELAREIRSSTSYDQDQDGDIDFASLVETIYDVSGVRVIRQGIDRDGDGSLDFIHEEQSFDSELRLLYRVQRFDFNDDNIPDTISFVENSYDSQGNHLSHFERIDGDGDGDWDYINATVSTFDDNRLLTQTHTQDNNGDGSPESASYVQNEYNPSGQLLSTVRAYDTDGDGNFNTSEGERYTYDAEGNKATFIKFEDYDGDEVDDLISLEVTYDTVGNELSRIIRQDGDRNSIPDYIAIQIYEFDSDRRVIATLYTVDYFGDGTIDYLAASSTTFDSNGRVLTHESYIDSNGDGVRESIYRQELSYSPNGELTLYHEVRDENGDGDIDSERVRTSTFDDAGRRLTNSEIADVTGNGNPEYVLTESFKYDASGQLIQHLRDERFDPNDDGAFDDIITFDYVVDVDNGVSTSSLTRDYNGDGVWDFSHFQVSEYDATGRRIATTDSYDDNGDGTIDRSTRLEWTFFDTTDHLLLTDDLIELVEDVVTSSSESRKLLKSLSRVTSVLRDANSSNDASAKNELQGFIQQVEKLAGNAISGEDIHRLNLMAEQIRLLI
jgi:hypothetical protein